MNNRQKNTDFFKRLILHEHPDVPHQLEERIRTAEKEERLIRTALVKVTLLAGFSIAGVYYSMTFLPDFLQNNSKFILKFFLALSAASLMSLVTFAGLWIRYIAILNGLCSQCRDLAWAAFERGRKQVHTIPFPRRVQLQDDDGHQNQTVTDSEGNSSQWQRAV